MTEQRTSANAILSNKRRGACSRAQLSIGITHNCDILINRTNPMQILRPLAVARTVAVIALLPASGASAQIATWRLSSAPTVSIGDATGATNASLGRVAGAVQLSDGTIAVADEAANGVKFFTRDGKFVVTSGRTGSGPGEYRAIRSLHRCGDSTVVVYDPSALRFTYLAASGALRRTVTVQALSEGGAPPYDVACNRAGQFALVNRSADPPTDVGPRRPHVAITVVSEGGQKIRLGEFPASERWFNGRNDFARPLGRITAVAMSPDRVYVSTGDSSAVHVFSIGGAPQANVGVVGTLAKVTTAHVDRFITDELDRSGTGDRSARERMLRSVTFPELFPLVRRIMLDPSGRLWLESFPLPGEPTVTWSVLSARGAQIARIAIPAAFSPTDISNDAMIGVMFDENTIPFVQRYTIQR